MGIHGVRNLFEDNEPKQEDGDKDFIKDTAGNNPHVMLPPLAEGFSYELQELPSGKTAVIVTGEAEVLEPEDKSCGCGKYQSCDVCMKFRAEKYQADDLNSPGSRTLRHKD